MQFVRLGLLGRINACGIGSLPNGKFPDLLSRFISIGSETGISKMLPQPKTLATRLQPRFDALAPERVDVILLHYANEMTGAEAKAACPLSTKETVWFGGVYGPVRLDPKECTWREFHWGAENAETLRHFHALAIDAGECIGAWATQFGVQQATLDESSATRWLNVLFDIALDSPRDPLFPMPADWHYFANVAMFSLRFQMQGASEARINELKNEYRSLGAIGYWAYLQDAVRASVYAIDVLTQEPLEFTTDGGKNRQKLAPVQGSVNPSTFAAQIRYLNKLPDYYERLRLCGLLIRQAVEAGQLADSKFDLLRMRLQSLDKADDDCVLEVVLRWANEQGQTAFHPDEMRPDGMLATEPIEHNIVAVADMLETAEMSAATHAERAGTTTADDVTPAIDALKRDVAAIKQATKKKTKTELIREQRNKFSSSRRPHKTWEEIYQEYRRKYPKDAKASPATLRLAFERNPTNNRQ